MAKNVTINQELVNKLSNIIKAYDPYTAYIEDYKQYSNAVAINCELDQQFIHTCNEYGYHVGVSFCYSLAESLASGKFDSAEETVIDYINSLTKEGGSMKQQNNVTTNNSTTEVKEEITMRELVNNTINRIETATKVQDAEYVTRDELAGIMEQLTSVRPGKKVTRKQMVQNLYVLEDDLQQMENANGSDCDSDTVVAVGDFCNDHAPESIESDHTPVVENPAPVSDAKAKTVEVLKLIKEAAVTNHNKGFGTTVSAYMLCAYILQAGYGIKKLKGHEAEITDEQKDTVKRVRQWLIDKGYIKACVYKTNDKSVYTDDYDGNRADSMIHHSKSLGLTCVGVSSYKVCF